MPPLDMTEGSESMAVLEGCITEPRSGVDGVFIFSVTDKFEEKKLAAIRVVIPGLAQRKDNQLVACTAVFNRLKKGEEPADWLESKQFHDFLNTEVEEVVIDNWVWSKTHMVANKSNIRMLHHRSSVVDIYGNPSAAHSHGIWLIQFREPSDTTAVKANKGHPGPDDQKLIEANNAINGLNPYLERHDLDTEKAKKVQY